MASSIALKSGTNNTGTLTFTGNKDITVDLAKMYSDFYQPVYGFIYNLTADSYKRFGTGTEEDKVWLSTFAERLNDTSNSDPITAFFNSEITVQGKMKRIVVNNQGQYVRDYNATGYAHPDQTGITATETVMVQIPKFHYINVSFVYNGDTYFIYGQSLNSFSIDLSTMGFSGASSISGQNVTGYKSYGSIAGTAITSKVHDAFNHATEGEKSWLYLGAFESMNNSTSYKSTCTTTGTSTAIKAVATQTMVTFRTQHQNFGARFQTQNWLEREALVMTLLIERGTFQTEVNGTTDSKWEAYSWRSGATSDDQNLGLTLVLGNTTGVIRDTSNRTIACSYRGVENPYGHLWEFVDGCNVISGAVWLAKHGDTYASNVTTAPYFNSGRTTLTAGSSVYISNMFSGTFIPSSTTDGSSATKMTDGFWGATGNTVLCVGGLQNYPSLSGSLSWASNTPSSNTYWNIGSRFATLV